MVRFSISQFSTYRWTLEQEVLEFGRRGIQNIGIWRAKFSDLDSDYAADLLYQNDLSVSSLSWAGGFTGTCGMSHEEAIEDGISAIRTAAKIGADCLIVHPGARGGHTRRHCRRLFAKAIERMLPVATDFGVTLSVEIMSRKAQDKWTVFDHQNEAVAFVQEYLPRELGMVLDLFHVGDNGEIFDSIPELADRVNLVQLSDRISHAKQPCRCRPGSGDLSVQKWFNKLEENGFDGLYEFEVFGPLFGALRYRQLLDDSAECFRQLKSGSLNKKSSTPATH